MTSGSASCQQLAAYRITLRMCSKEAPKNGLAVLLYTALFATRQQERHIYCKATQNSHGLPCSSLLASV